MKLKGKMVVKRNGKPVATVENATMSIDEGKRKKTKTTPTGSLEAQVAKFNPDFVDWLANKKRKKHDKEK